jgi:MATE family multidrug resistance protein
VSERGELEGNDPALHPFIARPHYTLVALSLPVLVSLVAEPLTGLVDTAFVAALGAAPLAGLGASVTLISAILWIFNFLGIGTQTEVARSLGSGDLSRGRDDAALAVGLGLGLGVALAALGWPLADRLATAMGTHGTTAEGAATYLRIRLLGGPAVLMSMAAFGALRGVQDMRTPLWIALGTNAMNVVLDAVLIFGAGPFPRLELAGAAWASTASQWVGAVWAIAAAARRLGRPGALRWQDAFGLLAVGRDLFFRTGLLMVFLVLATRAANRLGTDSGAAHQVVRQVWAFTAFGLDAYAAASQSLVGYFLSAARVDLVRQVARISCLWSIGSGCVLALAMIALTSWVSDTWVPDSARSVFLAAWWVAALSQPVNALSFATDGVHWGASDYGYLRNAMFVATVVGAVALWRLGDPNTGSLAGVWFATVVWIALRAGLGFVRIWPGTSDSPLAKAPLA